MNDLMSFGWHRFWKAYFIEILPWSDFPSPLTYLDMSCGTGDIGALVLQGASQRGIEIRPFLADPNPDMLAQAQSKLRMPIQWITSPAEHTPFREQDIDLYTIGFGLRNTQDRPQALREAFRILRPGGWFFCLEFSHPISPWIEWALQAYFPLLPLIGQFITGHSQPYKDLCQSIKAFPSQKELAMELTQAGFSQVTYSNLSSGLVAIHKGQKHPN